MTRNIWSRVLGVLGLVLLVSTMVTFLFGNTQLVMGKALLGLAGIAAGFALGEQGGVKRFFTGRAAHYGFFTALSALLVVAVLGAVNFVAYRKPRSWDLTKDRIFTLSDDTLRTLAGLSADVKATAVYRQDEPDHAAALDILKRYAARSPRFSYEMADPYRHPEVAKRLSITEGGPRIVLSSGKEEARVRTPDEQSLTNALVQVTRKGSRRAYFTTGHGEPDPRDQGGKGYASAVKGLESEGYEVSALALYEREDVPDDAALVLVAAPRKKLLETEVRALERYLSKGGHLGVFLEPEVDAGLDGLLAAWGVQADDDMVVDPSPVAQLFGGSPVTPIVKPSAAHEITRELASTGLIFPTARSLAALTTAGVTPAPLVLTGPGSWGETDVQSLYGRGARRDEGEKGGPLPVALAVQKPAAGEGARSAETRLVVTGDGEFFSNQYVQLLGNLDFFLNTASWLAQQGDRITIRPRSREASRVFLTQAQVSAIKFVTIDALPVGLLGLGLAVWLVRRSR